MNVVNAIGSGLLHLAPSARDLYERIAQCVGQIPDDRVGGILGSALRELPRGEQQLFVRAVERLRGNLEAKKIAIALSACTPDEREQYRAMTAQSGIFGAGFHGMEPTNDACTLADILARWSA